MRAEIPGDKTRFENLLFGSRRMILIPVIGSLLAAVTSMVIGALVIINAAVSLILHPVLNEDIVKETAVVFIETIDLFLLGTVFYIIAIGLYTLFVNPQIKLTGWLQIDSLDNLKSKLLGVVIVLLAVTFLGQVVLWKGGMDILYLGAGVGFVLAALAVLLNFGDRRDGDHPLH